MSKDYYKHLGLPRTATEAEIKSAYRRLANAHHPDKNGDPALFLAINEAYGILGDAAKKKAYDESQSVALVTNLDEVAMTVIEDYFSQFQQPPHPTHE
ncbi:DnaJ domain-containing protein [Verrucomicrobium sp. GAS474]|uniref:DnaJ domain-containing protein n=1 Tax=Verrucomicrobium sp. GAS474 TaxID=1882831 RepID=UPI000879CF93|nr:DnaJ domain-containing protein [Verrucomicrobium sp. GAS474]SDT89663.1 DnaJ domain-containing protein [Verrucomicrobium sp. GAS474]